MLLDSWALAKTGTTANKDTNKDFCDKNFMKDSNEVKKGHSL
jgi:hypothetical protein